MIAYFDSSSIVKWFFDEPQMELARDLRDQARVVCTSPVSLPEAMSAINRAWKEKRCSRGDAEKVRGELLRIWPALTWVRPDAPLVDQAGQLVFKHDLKGMDALHLASALLLKREGNGAQLVFSCFDRRLNRAATKEGLRVHKAYE